MKAYLKKNGRAMLLLFAVVAASCVLLGVVSAVTGEAIARREAARHHETLVSVLPDADVFSRVEVIPESADAMYAAYKRDAHLGYCVELTANGFGGAMRLLVGVRLDGVVTGVSLLSHQETEGLGSGVADPAFLEQFNGLSGVIEAGPGGVIDAVSGATESSRAVARGVTRGLALVAEYQQKGGGASEEGAV